MPLTKVYAYDVADKKKLWELDLFGSTPNPAVQQQGRKQQMEADGLRLTYQDGWSTKVGQQWVVEATYTVVLTKDGLIAKDNARGTVLWTKSNVSPRTHMIGDGEFVFLYDVNPDGNVSPVRCYRAADGVEVTVPDSSAAFTNVKRAKFYGRKVLAFDDEPGKKAVRLYDLYTGKDIWKKDLGADGWQLRSEDDSYAGYVTMAGDVVVLSAADGKDVFRAKLDEAKKGKHLEKVNDAMLLADGERFFVMLNRPSEGRTVRLQPGVHSGDPGGESERAHVRVRAGHRQAIVVHRRAARGTEHLDGAVRRPADHHRRQPVPEVRRKREFRRAVHEVRRPRQGDGQAQVRQAGGEPELAVLLDRVRSKGGDDRGAELQRPASAIRSRRREVGRCRGRARQYDHGIGANHPRAAGRRRRRDTGPCQEIGLPEPDAQARAASRDAALTCAQFAVSFFSHSH